MDLQETVRSLRADAAVLSMGDEDDEQVESRNALLYAAAVLERLGDHALAGRCMVETRGNVEGITIYRRRVLEGK